MNDGTSEEQLRLAALEGLAGLGGKKSVKELSGLAASKGAARPLRHAAVVALTRLDLGEAAFRAPALLADEKADGTQEVFDAFIQRKGGGAALAEALGGKNLPADV